MMHQVSPSHVLINSSTWRLNADELWWDFISHSQFIYLMFCKGISHRSLWSVMHDAEGLTVMNSKPITEILFLNVWIILHCDTFYCFQGICSLQSQKNKPSFLILQWHSQLYQLVCCTFIFLTFCLPLFSILGGDKVRLSFIKSSSPAMEFTIVGHDVRISVIFITMEKFNKGLITDQCHLFNKSTFTQTCKAKYIKYKPGRCCVNPWNLYLWDVTASFSVVAT